MSGEGTATALPAEAPPAWTPRPGWRYFRLSLAVGWVLLLLGLAAFAERTSSFDDLQTAVAAGEVHSVEVTPALERGDSGFRTVELRWRTRYGRHVARVEQVRRQTDRPGENDDVSAVVHRDPAAILIAQQPGLRVERSPVPREYNRILGWGVPSRLDWVLLVLGLGSLVLLVGGPEPWRATRWAWFWFASVAFPLFVVAFVLLGGPVRRDASPPAGRRRLRG